MAATERNQAEPDGMGRGKKAVLRQGFDCVVMVTGDGWCLIALFLLRHTAVFVGNDNAHLNRACIQHMWQGAVVSVSC